MRRLFTDEFKLGEEVDVFRTRHGWHDGKLRARITKICPRSCEVTDSYGFIHEILHPRDIKGVH